MASPSRSEQSIYLTYAHDASSDEDALSIGSWPLDDADSLALEIESELSDSMEFQLLENWVWPNGWTWKDQLDFLVHEGYCDAGSTPRQQLEAHRSYLRHVEAHSQEQYDDPPGIYDAERVANQHEENEAWDQSVIVASVALAVLT